MSNPIYGPGWRPARHPTLADRFCLVRRDAIGQYERLGNRVTDSPSVEAFATREQAARVAEHLARRLTKET
jgi:hypothetical protein